MVRLNQERIQNGIRIRIRSVTFSENSVCTSKNFSLSSGCDSHECHLLLLDLQFCQLYITLHRYIHKIIKAEC